MLAKAAQRVDYGVPKEHCICIDWQISIAIGVERIIRSCIYSSVIMTLKALISTGRVLQFPSTGQVRRTK